MATEAQRFVKNKDIILSTIVSRGPSLPIHLARIANISTLFASAYLSELYSEKKVLMSSMKVGSTSLYFLQGQEAQLENFIQYLNQKEQEAFNLLKKEKILDNESLEPAIRVAMKEIKDFAIPFPILINEQQKLFWKYFLLPNEEAKSTIQDLFSPKKTQKIKKEMEEPLTKEISQIQKTLPDKKTRKKAFSAEESKFHTNVKEYLSSKDIEILEVKEEKKSFFSAKVRIDTLLGKQEFLLIAKEKKKLSEEDILIALHKAQAEKMPAFLLTPGEIDKKSLSLLHEWRALLKFEKLKSQTL